MNNRRSIQHDSIQHDRAVRSTASSLEQKGYSVIIEPDPSVIPFDLQHYCPDILATRGQENLVVEIKTRRSSRSIERYKEIADIIGSHKNWHFMLSTIDVEDIDQANYTQSESSIDSGNLHEMLGRLDKLLAGENYDLALPYLWTLYIFAMRLSGQNAGIPIDINSDRSVLNYMYSLGEISADEFDWGCHFLHLRNQAVHHFKCDLSRDEIQDLYSHIQDKLTEWKLFHSDRQT